MKNAIKCITKYMQNAKYMKSAIKCKQNYAKCYKMQNKILEKGSAKM
jgi:hypothetical protein